MGKRRQVSAVQGGDKSPRSRAEALLRGGNCCAGLELLATEHFAHGAEAVFGFVEGDGAVPEFAP